MPQGMGDIKMQVKKKEAKKAVILCGLCGEPIPEPPKGFPKNRLTQEQQEGVHKGCKMKYRIIQQKFNLGPFSIFEAYREGLTELFPEITETKAVKDYNAKIANQENELAEAFPYLKERRDAIEKPKTE